MDNLDQRIATLINDLILSKRYAKIGSKGIALYMVILFYTNEAGIMFAPVADLISNSGLDASDIEQTLIDLEQQGLVIRHPIDDANFVRVDIPGLA